MVQKRKPTSSKITKRKPQLQKEAPPEKVARPKLPTNRVAFSDVVETMADSLEEFFQFPEPKHDNARAMAEIGARVLLYKDHVVANKEIKLHLCELCDDE
jgi:hypothetical protein